MKKKAFREKYKKATVKENLTVKEEKPKKKTKKGAK